MDGRLDIDGFGSSKLTICRWPRPYFHHEDSVCPYSCEMRRLGSKMIWKRVSVRLVCMKSSRLCEFLLNLNQDVRRYPNIGLLRFFSVRSFLGGYEM